MAKQQEIKQNQTKDRRFRAILLSSLGWFVVGAFVASFFKEMGWWILLIASAPFEIIIFWRTYMNFNFKTSGRQWVSDLITIVTALGMTLVMFYLMQSLFFFLERIFSLIH